MTFVRLIIGASTKWSEDRAQRLAAALAYYSVFSLAPILLVTAGLVGLLFGDADMRGRLLEGVAAILGRRGAQAVGGMMGDTDAATRSGVMSTITGLGTFLIAAVAVVAQLKEALNSVWDVKVPARLSWMAWVRLYLMNVAVVVSTGFLLLISLVVTTALSAVTAGTRRWLNGPEGLWFSVDFAFGFAMAAGIFALIFRVIPDAPVRWRDAWVGGAFTAVLFTAGRLVLGFYLGREGGESVYEAAGSVVALLVWVYYSAQLVLFGAEFTFVYSTRSVTGAIKPERAKEQPL